MSCLEGSLYATMLSVPCALIVFWVIQRLVIDYQLSRHPGVKASLLASNPFTALYFVCEAAYMQANNRLLDYFNGIYRHAKPGCVNTVEISIAGHRVLITRDPEHIKTILTSKYRQFGKGRKFHDAWRPFLGDSIFTTDGQLWQKSRSLIRPMFTNERFRNLGIFDRWAAALISKLPPSGRTVDICDLFYRMTLDVTTEFLLGNGVGALDDARSDFARAFAEVQRMQMILTILHPIRWVVPRGKYLKAIKVIEHFIEPYIESVLHLTQDELEQLSKQDTSTFLHNVVLFSRDRTFIRDQIMAVLLAGRDSTAATLSWAIYELSNYPEIWAKLRSQVLELVGPNRRPTYRDLRGLTYLTNTLNETLRLYPAVPYNLRECLEASTLPGAEGQPDIATLSGDVIIYSTLAMQRRKDLYPAVSERFADPAVFSPERWDYWTPKPWSFVPFNGGPRICLGQNFAMTEMAFTLVRLLQKYERVEYRGDWSAQYHKAEIVGCPGHGVPIAFFDPQI